MKRIVNYINCWLCSCCAKHGFNALHAGKFLRMLIFKIAVASGLMLRVAAVALRVCVVVLGGWGVGGVIRLQ